MLAPNEPRVDIEYTVRQARGGQCGEMGGASENSHIFGTEMLGS